MATSASPRRAVVVLWLVAAIVTAGGCGTTSPRVTAYGDSLTYESEGALQDAFRGHARLRVVAQGGAALCDALPGIGQDVQKRKPKAALVQFTGNNSTDCVRDAAGRPLEGADLVAKYAADLEQAVTLLRGAGIDVYLVGSPTAGAPSSIPAINTEMRRIAQQWAADGGVTYVDAGAAVLAPDGTFTATLPCLDDETAASGCAGGVITVRSPDALHFCPVATGGTAPCPVYASGARRFADAMAAPVVSDLEGGILSGL